ncbi:hypothetical protein JVT61DRAFT_13254 [Boletus reticuloceps]|uniref:Uncharacterized protein n=1 Tax=Boletus reticuloceps TaxID=495285 RepID=A0A8I2YYQ6_9AGAM|nr:hypothetical protein JVT61DRAFT_13254 [Boletus reticuloceps]
MFTDSLVNRPNTVLEQQRVFQSSHSPVYLRTPRARLYLGTHPLGSLSNHQRHRVHMDLLVTGIYFSIYAVGMAGTAYGIYSLAFSKPMKKD